MTPAAEKYTVDAQLTKYMKSAEIVEIDDKIKDLKEDIISCKHSSEITGLKKKIASLRRELNKR